MLNYNPIHMLDGIAFTSMTPVYALHGMFFFLAIWLFFIETIIIYNIKSRIYMSVFSTPHLKLLGFTKCVGIRALSQAPYFLNDHGNA